MKLSTLRPSGFPLNRNFQLFKIWHTLSSLWLRTEWLLLGVSRPEPNGPSMSNIGIRPRESPPSTISGLATFTAGKGADKLASINLVILSDNFVNKSFCMDFTTSNIVLWVNSFWAIPKAAAPDEPLGVASITWPFSDVVFWDGAPGLSKHT